MLQRGSYIHVIQRHCDTDSDITLITVIIMRHCDIGIDITLITVILMRHCDRDSDITLITVKPTVISHL